MKINYEKIYSFAIKYQNEDTGHSWENLFDFTCEHGEGVYDSNYFNEFKYRFSKYLGNFGMFRGKKLLSKVIVGNILEEGRPEYIGYLKERNDRTFVAAWKKTYDILRAKHRSTNPVVITKILMGLGGLTPAYDRRFLAAITSHPLLMSAGITKIVQGIKLLGKPPLRTRGKNEIPWERVLDMAFWYVSNESEWLVD